MLNNKKVQARDQNTARHYFITEWVSSYRTIENLRIKEVRKLNPASHNTFWWDIVFEQLETSQKDSTNSELFKESKYNELYDKLVKEDMTCASVTGGVGPSEISVGNQDTYAPGDARVPKVLWKKKGKNKKTPIQRRNMRNTL